MRGSIRSLRASAASVVLAATFVDAAAAPPVPPVDAARLMVRTLCSCLFVQQDSASQCADERAAIWRYPFAEPPPLLRAQDDALEMRRVPDGIRLELRRGDAARATAVYVSDGGGCVTREPSGHAPVRAESRTAPDAPEVPGTRDTRSPSVPLPRAPLAPSAADAVARALDDGFAPEGPLRGFARAALVLHRGRVVAERYAHGYSGDRQYYLGSVAKVLNNLLAGLLVQEGKLDIRETVRWSGWRAAGDPRTRITYEHLLRMTSGLRWDEDFFTPGAAAYEIYFGGSHGADVAGYVAAAPLEAEPGRHFEYSTGASALLARLLQQRLGGDPRRAALDYLHSRLWSVIGASGITTEFDAAGTLLFGHAVWARPDALARIGLLLANDGRWEGRRVLPEGWVARSTAASARPAEDSGYGAHLDLDAVDVPGCFGHGGVGEQHLVVCPDRELVVVWFSSVYDFSGTFGDDPSDAVVRRIVLAFPPANDAREQRQAGRRQAGAAPARSSARRS